MKQLKIASAIFGIGLFFSATACAEEGHESASNSHELSNSPEQIEQKVSHEQKQKTADGKNDNSEMSRQVMRIIDTNNDKKVSKEEYLSYAQRRFEEVDVNGDNFISRTEGRAAAHALREQQDEAKSFLRDKIEQ